MAHRISRVMSTQHPDNVTVPFFAEHEVLSGDDEVKEAFYAFSHLGINEQLWDSEGKEADSFVIKKLLSRYEPFFRKNPLGEEKTISLRVPNPRVEKADAKILIEALHSITRSHDIAAAFYGDDCSAPIPQVYVPMTKDAKDVLRVKAYYDAHIIKAQSATLLPKDLTVQQWLGRFRPETIRVSPLFEDKEAILGAHLAAKELLDQKAQNNDEFLRVWFARSDPALNYSSAANVLLLKVALPRLHELQEKSSVDILPIVGCGSAPFRGHFTPDNVKTFIKGYPSVQTFTTQSSFKYDHPIEKVRSAIDTLNTTKRKKPIFVEEQKLLPIIEKLSAGYQEQVRQLAPIVNHFSPNIPQRRKRKMHIGLFGYTRDSAGVKLPRAIPFTAALYSLGLPPELLGLHALNEKELDVLQDAWKNFAVDHEAAAQYYNPDNLRFFPQLVQEDIKKVLARFPADPDPAHQKITSIIRENFQKERHDLVREDVIRAAFVRRFLG